MLLTCQKKFFKIERKMKKGRVGEDQHLSENGLMSLNNQTINMDRVCQWKKERRTNKRTLTGIDVK